MSAQDRDRLARTRDAPETYGTDEEVTQLHSATGPRTGRATDESAQVSGASRDDYPSGPVPRASRYGGPEQGQLSSSSATPGFSGMSFTPPHSTTGPRSPAPLSRDVSVLPYSRPPPIGSPQRSAYSSGNAPTSFNMSTNYPHPGTIHQIYDQYQRPGGEPIPSPFRPGMTHSGYGQGVDTAQSISHGQGRAGEPREMQRVMPPPVVPHGLGLNCM